MTRRALLVYPLLFATAPVLSVAARNPGQYRAADLLAVVAAVLAGFTLLLVLTALVLRRWEPPERAEEIAAALVMVAVAWFFFYLPLRNTITPVARSSSLSYLYLLVWVLASVAVAAWLGRRPEARRAVARALTVAGALLVGMGALRIVASHVRAARVIATSQLARTFGAPTPTRAVPAGRNAPRRDIYLIVLDTRVNAAVLRERVGADDAAFEDSLRALGFVIPRDMRSNYAQTLVSLPSLLNFEHVTRLADDAGRESRDYSLAKHLIAHNRAARFLQERGYKYVFFPSAWSGLSEHSPAADEEFDARPGFDLRDELRRTELRRFLVRSTPLRKFGWVGVDRFSDPAHYFRTFDALERVPADTAPTFAFAHFLLPHAPFLLDSACRPSARPVLAAMEEANTPDQRAAYLGQLRCTNRLVLDMVTTVLRRSRTPPIILIVGDHGTRFSNAGYWRRPAEISPAFARERFGAFGAFYAPAGGDSAFVEPVTLVNVLRSVFRYYFGAELPPLPNDAYMTGNMPYAFHRVDTRNFARGRSAAAPRQARARPETP